MLKLLQHLKLNQKKQCIWMRQTQPFYLKYKRYETDAIYGDP